MALYFMSDPDEENFTSVFMELLAEEFKDATYSEDEIVEMVAATLRSSLDSTTPEVFAELLKYSKHAIAHERAQIRNFNRRNYKRWKPALDLLHVMILISQDLGTYILKEAKDTEFEQPAKAHAIINLHAKSLRIGREILCLLENGFADGALGRWRALHEAATVASFLAHREEELSVRYILARTVQSYRAAKQYVEHEDRANLTPLGPQVLEELKTAYDQIIAEHGEEMRHDWGWASKALDNKRPTFVEIEKACGLDHWRPRYRWSSEDSHANYKPNETHLAHTEALEPLLIAGQSNSGMEDPGQMLGCSINLAASTLLALNPNPDIQLWLRILVLINDKVSDELFKSGARTS